ncbi:hypothetical protein FFI89_021395 [Bradyrhizobium sp. KBS0727]|uniref:hypothetical protein n=1 Tax=unclassified Bradyrhizobium TaxID=2631580 RepID=UPI00110F5D98|nr:MULTISPECIES: hypothetical protein [unclassified Bradyrhizobium]QDW39468.1 hypothetical protein FFI71_021400 [Bradyrhizobium sp. KBS0725]QDW46071.1 hypothetical protein FFI89_021395 [Bradyrhizobium sp. KBS0727]
MNRLEVPEIQITARDFFVGSSVADFRLEIRKLVGILKIEFVLEDSCTGIAVIVGSGVVHWGYALR